MDVCYFDLIVGAIVLLLGLKGILNGFFKELFGLVGIIGGIFIASRFGDEVGKAISDAIFHFENEAAVSFTGFLVALALFWVAMILLGALFKKLSKESGLGVVDRIFGFVIGSGKFFLIAAVIVYAMFNIKAINSKLQSVNEKSILFPIMVEVGGYIMHLDPVELSQEVNTTVEESTKSVSETVSEGVDKVTEAISETAEGVIEEEAQVVIEKVKQQIETNATEPK